MSSLFKKEIGKVYTDDPVSEFLAGCALLIIGGFILYVMFAS